MLSPHPDDDDDESDGWDNRPTPSVPPPNLMRRTRSLVLQQWNPKPLPPPRVDPALPQFNALERSAEVFRYSANRLEYWISPSGWLREWLRFNIRLALLLAIPSLLVVPLITFALGQLSVWSDMLAHTTSRMILFPLSALLIVGLVCGLIYITRSIAWQRPRRHSYYE
jgi:hypothetical protein